MNVAMDPDSSTKFISSLAKFLQSLCNGYVEFDNGVEVIGHIYLSVDTGKKIDYILNEKVCKTDENSVTFISNSFHAQPAEKPKLGKKTKDDQANDQSSNVQVNDNDDNVNNGNQQIEPKSTNTGTVSEFSNTSFSTHSSHLGKRPFSPHPRHSPSGQNSKRSRSQNHGIVSNESCFLTSSSPAPDPLRGQPPNSSLSEASHNHDDDDGERDIKPSLDTDVTFVKEEFTSSNCSQDGSSSQGVADSYSSSSMYHSNPPYHEGGPLDQSYDRQASNYIEGEQSEFYDTNMMQSQDGSEDQANESAELSDMDWLYPAVRTSFPEDAQKNRCRWKGRILNRPTLCCPSCGRTYKRRSELNRHKWKCMGLRVLECEICHKSFHRKDVLNVHMRQIHWNKMSTNEISTS